MSLGKKIKNIVKNPVTALSPVTGIYKALTARTGAPAGGNPAADFASAGRTTFDYLPQTAPYLKQYVDKLDTPTSTDEVYNQLNNQQLQRTLENVGLDTARSVGSVKSDFLDRGLGGPDQLSDIEANALATTRAAGDRTAADARLAAYGKGIDRLNSKQDLVDAAYGSQYNAALGGAAASPGLYDQLLGTGANLGLEQQKLQAEKEAAKRKTNPLYQLQDSFLPAVGQAAGGKVGNAGGDFLSKISF